MTSHPVVSPKRLIEVALPLDAINAASVREGYIYRGNPSALHKWWAQRPLAAARAVLFGQLVLDPEDLWRCQNPGKEPNQQVRGHWTKARGKLFTLIEDLVKWENTTNEVVMSAAREAIRESWRQTCELNKHHPQANELFDPNRMPGLCDPFAGGGTIPLEAQRLGLDAHASDLNPVAVLINKAMIEIPPKFAGYQPVNPAARKRQLVRECCGAEGLADDIRYYGQWMRDEAQKRIGHLYPSIEVTKAMAAERPDLEPCVGESLTVIAWLWARTVKSPSPAFSHRDVPLASTFVVSSREGREVFVEPVIQGDRYVFKVRLGAPPATAKSGTKAGRGGSFRCVLSAAPIAPTYIRAEGVAGRLGARLMAVVALSTKGRIYVDPTDAMEDLARSAEPKWLPEGSIVEKHRAFTPTIYGFAKWSDLFTSRQLVAMTTMADLVTEVLAVVEGDALSCMPSDLQHASEANGKVYARAVVTYLAISLSKLADYNCSLVPWYSKENRPGHLFSQQAVPIVWDYTELNPLTDIGGSLAASIKIVSDALHGCCPGGAVGTVTQASATSNYSSPGVAVSTDPPYYDNVPYADLADFFYVWLRRTLRSAYPDLFATLETPKSDELVATPERHGGKREAELFFLTGMEKAMRQIAACSHPALPITIYYAFKQGDTDNLNGTTSAGWETFLAGVVRSGLAVCGTWPIRTERGARSRGQKSNALASSIVLVCRPRLAGTGTISRRQFVRELNEALPLALDAMTRESEGLHSPVAPVDLSQAIIGPGMAIFSRYDAVLEADGSPMTVRTALQLINRFLAEDDFDADTQFCLHWFDQHGWEAGKFGEADTLARAKGTTVDGVKVAGVIESGGGSVRLLRWREYPADWDPAKDARTPVWEVLHQLIRAYRDGGDSAAAAVLTAAVTKVEAARQLAYRLYTLCERKNWSEDARAYNELVTGWAGIETAAAAVPAPKQQTLFDTKKDSR